MNRPPKSERQQGQILIMMALLSTTLIILFGMVVGIGHLVEAKINLQNAVDLAAMSGASWQARYLNHVALVNYRMRQNYKYVLYDLYVTQSRFNKGFRDVVASQYSPGMAPFTQVPKNRWVFGICQQKEGYFPQAAIHETGEGTAPGTDMCRNVDDTQNYIPPITPSPIVGTNPILIAANEAIRQLSLRAQNVCRGASGQNTAYFNYIMKHLDTLQSFQMQQLQNVLTSFSQAFQPGSQQPLNGSGGVAAASVYNTFSQNLISANGNATLQFINPDKTLSVNENFSSVFQQMFQTRQPPPPQFTDYFEVLESFFRIRVTNINVDGAGGCQFSVQDKVYPVGASGNSLGTFLGLGRARNSSNTNYPKIPFSVVLRAEVQPNLLFWPRQLTPTLVAVAAAKPFGSRVGPPKSQSDYEVSGGASLKSGGADNYPMANMSFYPGDVDTGDGKYSGVGHVKILGFLYNSLVSPTTGTNFNRPSINNVSGNCENGDTSFLCLALAPTLYEGLFWNAFPYPPGASNAAPGPAVMSSLFPNDVSNLQVSSPDYAMLDRMPGASASNLWHYTTDDLGSNPQFMSTDGSNPLFFSNRSTTLSSWSPSDTNFQQGRMGYQIKLASLAEICSDISNGGSVSLTDALAGYCNGNLGYNQVSH